MRHFLRTLSIGLLTLLVVLSLAPGRAAANTSLRTLPIQTGPKAPGQVSGQSTPYGTLEVPAYSDVPEDSLFHHEITWLGSVGITTGYADGTYRPLDTVNRDAMAAFLYRMAGEPEFTAPAVSPFSDVSTDNEFYTEIAWLASQRIATGWSDGTFRPLQPVARDAMAAFIYRLVGSPDHTAPAVSPFRDVPVGAMFYKEITWLASTGVTTGWPDGTFRPLDTVKRDAMAAFLYRLGSFYPDRTYVATGSAFIDFPKLGARYWTASIDYETSDPDSQFVIYTVDAEGRRIGPIAGTFGPYHGTVGVNSYQQGMAGDVAGLEVVADDAWTIKLRGVEQEEAVSDGQYLGSWDRVLRVGAIAGKNVDFTYEGEGVFIVIVTTRDGEVLDVPIDELGPWSGSYTLPSDAYAIEVIVDGRWQMTT